MINNADKPAYPLLDKLVTEGVDLGLELKEPGLTKREMFAMAAMQGILSHREKYLDCPTAASYSVKFADALLEELEK